LKLFYIREYIGAHTCIYLTQEGGSENMHEGNYCLYGCDINACKSTRKYMGKYDGIEKEFNSLIWPIEKYKTKGMKNDC